MCKGVMSQCFDAVEMLHRRLDRGKAALKGAFVDYVAHRLPWRVLFSTQIAPWQFIVHRVKLT